MPLNHPHTGLPAVNIDRTILISLWCKKLSEEGHSIIAACMGKPTFPISQFAAQAAITYWNEVSLRSQKARHLLSGDSSDAATRDEIIKMEAAIGYGDPRGDEDPRKKMASALTRWYDNRVTIQPGHILFTVGGAGALHAIFTAINKRIPHGIIVTPFPHYALYAGPEGTNRLFPIDVMKEKGYRLSAEALSKALQAATAQAEIEGTQVSTFLLCDPNNPLGTALSENELKQIAGVLKQYPDIFIVLDEAYAEMRLTGNHKVSLLHVAPELQDRIILMRSATKGLSAAGDRMAIAVTTNEEIISNLLLTENVNVYGHAPRSSQNVYAAATKEFDPREQKNLRNFYKPQVELVAMRLKEMGAAMPDSDYQVEGAFYIMADLSDLFGEEISEAAARALGKRGKIETDEELIYSLLFDNGVGVAPLSYFGISNRCGYVRITCSGGDSELMELMDRLERRLIAARLAKQKQLESQLSIDPTNPKNMTALALKESNATLKKIILDKNPEERKKQDTARCQSFFRKIQADVRKTEEDYQWRELVNQYFSEGAARVDAYLWPSAKRLAFKPWVDFLKKSQEQQALSQPRSKL